MSAATTKDQGSSSNMDTVWTSSATARQIHALGAVENDISRLLSLASSSLALLTLPQTDESDGSFSQSDERSEQFVQEVTQYFETLDSIQLALRNCLSQLRRSRIAPSSIEALPHGFVPTTSGVGLPQGTGTTDSQNNRGLQEVRVERDAWKAALDALQRLKDAKFAAPIAATPSQIDPDGMVTT